ncbi:MAG: hypothetical protein ACREQJ_08340 [Candidatus Binatia bacterium]
MNATAARVTPIKQPAHWQPEHRLAVAMLVQAATDAASADVGRRADALRWIGGATARLSFELVCGSSRRPPGR